MPKANVGAEHVPPPKAVPPSRPFSDETVENITRRSIEQIWHVIRERAVPPSAVRIIYVGYLPSDEDWPVIYPMSGWAHPEVSQRVVNAFRGTGWHVEASDRSPHGFRVSLNKALHGHLIRTNRR